MNYTVRQNIKKKLNTLQPRLVNFVVNFFELKYFFFIFLKPFKLVSFDINRFFFWIFSPKIFDYPNMFESVLIIQRFLESGEAFKVYK